MSHLILIDRSKIDQSSEGAATTKLSATMKLDRLPEVILRRIFEFLLSAKEVRQPASADEGYVIKYHFHTAIMRVNKSIHFLAQGVFVLNHFTLVSTNCMYLTDTIDGYGLWTWRNKLAKFKQYHGRLNIKVRNALPESKMKYRFFLVCLDQIEVLARIVHMYELGNEMSFAFNFEIKHKLGATESSMPLKRQHDLLEPFTKIQGVKQTCLVTGAANLSLAKRVEMLMSPRLVWIRARAWAAYDAAILLKRRGDEAFRDHHFTVALRCWIAVVQYFTGLQCPATKLSMVADANIHDSRQCLLFTTCINTQLARLHLARTNNDDSYYEQVAEMSLQRFMFTGDLALFFYNCAIAAFALRKTDTAYRICVHALRHEQGTGIVRQGLDIISSWMQSAKTQKKTRSQRVQTLQELFDLLPKEPVASPRYLENPVESELATESYILEEWGYHGDKLTWLVEHAGLNLNDPQILNKREADVLVSAQKKELTEGKDGCLIVGARYDSSKQQRAETAFGIGVAMPAAAAGLSPEEMLSSMGFMAFR
jgi:hypothetical protein